MMRVLHLSKFDGNRGAAIATKRLHERLLLNGIDSWLLCDQSSGETQNSISMRKKPNWLLSKINNKCTRMVKSLQHDREVYYLSLNFWKNLIAEKIAELEPDIVHLHWVGDGFLRIEDVPKLCNKYRIVWTLHDMWPFCGAEHIAFSDERWRNGYTKSNRPVDAEGIDLNRWVWQRKQRSWLGCTIHTIGVSTWMNECVTNSKLFKGVNGARVVIHNGIDMDVFQRSATSAQTFSDKTAVPRIAFLANPIENSLKGSAILVDALKLLHRDKIELDIVTFGGLPLESLPPIGRVTHLGRIDGSEKLAEVYSSVDLFVTPSRMESFGQTAVEALACGTPVVCFDTTGLKDIVKHHSNGYRASCYSAESLAEGIRWCLSDKKRHKDLQSAARGSVDPQFNIQSIAERTIRFYEKILAMDTGCGSL